MSTLSIENGTVVTPGVESGVRSVWIDAEGRFASSESVGEELDATGCFVLPGFIDIHTHGAAGVSVMDGNGDAVRAMAKAKLKEGVTQFLPTTWTAPNQDLASAFQGVAEYQENQDACRVPGIHVEGPYLNPACLGAQNPEHARLPDLEEVDQLAEIAPIRLISLAAELEGGVSLIEGMRQRGITSSMAHTAATYSQFLAAKEAGLTHLTHYSNQMTPLHHREIGMVGAGLLDDEVMLELICDGIHLAPEMIAMIFKNIPLERLMLITDSVTASWMPDGKYDEAGLRVEVQDGICRLPEGNLAGSTLHFDRALACVHEVTDLSLEKLVCTTSLNQAQSLGLDGFGKIETNAQGDLVLLEEGSLEVRATVVGGDVRYHA